MVVSQNKGTPIYNNPYNGDPQKVPLILGNPQIGFRGLGTKDKEVTLEDLYRLVRGLREKSCCSPL